MRAKPAWGGAGVYAAALLPCLAAGILREGLPLIVLMTGVSVLTAFLFAKLNRRPRIPGAELAGLSFALTLPSDAPLLQAAMSMVFGLIVAREIFGKLERSFVHPAVLAHVFLALTWPDALGSAARWLPPDGVVLTPTLESMLFTSAGGALGSTSALACLIGAGVLLVSRLISWRVLAAIPIGVAAGIGILGHPSAAGPLFVSSHLLLGGALFASVFLAADPPTSPRHRSAQWFHGFLVGFLILLFRVTDPSSPDGVIPAVLIASVFAPLFDRAAVAGRRGVSGVSHV